MIEVSNSLKVYEIDGKEIDASTKNLRVVSHWNRDAFVVLVIDMAEYTVVAKDLIAATKNAQNTGR